MPKTEIWEIKCSIKNLSISATNFYAPLQRGSDPFLRINWSFNLIRMTVVLFYPQMFDIFDEMFSLDFWNETGIFYALSQKLWIFCSYSLAFHQISILILSEKKWPIIVWKIFLIERKKYATTLWTFKLRVGFDGKGYLYLSTSWDSDCFSWVNDQAWRKEKALVL